MRRPDPPSLVAGAVIAALGGLLLTERLDAVELSFGLLVPICLATVGVVLLISGLTRRG